ncbi:helix-turn-helix transcriptional regulator [Nakamurella lactea]|uniref:helix-turn-helix transcriptional regulator n=1 Tax=Nakamurella lactea TaxID=459515 RepID=UPI0004127710|nr:WYL domain-containing protein [Nakamurella lactea]
MPQTAVRLLSLLSLLQCQRSWTGAELAERLGVSTRTIRNDVERLRELGYSLEGSRGSDGGYRLGAGGSALPPLLLDPEEATAVAVGLRTGINCIIGGMEETSMRALAKLEQTLPSHLRVRVRNLNRYTVPLPLNHPMPIVDPTVLILIVGLCDSRERLRFSYADAATPAAAGSDAAGSDAEESDAAESDAEESDAAESDAEESDDSPTRHDVEPYRLINRQHRWYLLAFDVGASSWAVFGVERIQPVLPAGPRFTARELPTDDIATYVAEHGPTRSWRHHARVTLHAPASVVQRRVTSAEGTVEPVDEQSCALQIGAESLTTIALTLGRLGVDFTVVDPPELRAEVRRLADRYARGIGDGAATSGPSTR